jgi:hypothetical protein
MKGIFDSLILILICIHAGQAWTYAEKHETFPKAQQNEVLRQYFSSSCYHNGVGSSSYARWGRQVDIPSTGGTNPVFLEQCIDQQIDRFVADIHEELEKIRTDLEAVQDESQNCRAQDDFFLNGANRARFKERFSSLRKLSNDIYGDLRNIFPFLKHKEEFDLLVTEDSFKACFADEITLLRLHLELADKQIREYFSGPQTVSADQADQNMILILFRAREIASRLSK